MVKLSKDRYGGKEARYAAEFCVDSMPKAEDERFVVDRTEVITFYAPTRALALKGLREKLVILQAQILVELESLKP